MINFLLGARRLEAAYKLIVATNPIVPSTTLLGICQLLCQGWKDCSDCADIDGISFNQNIPHWIDALLHWGHTQMACGDHAAAKDLTYQIKSLLRDQTFDKGDSGTGIPRQMVELRLYEQSQISAYQSKEDQASFEMSIAEHARMLNMYSTEVTHLIEVNLLLDADRKVASGELLPEKQADLVARVSYRMRDLLSQTKVGAQLGCSYFLQKILSSGYCGHEGQCIAFTEALEKEFPEIDIPKQLEIIYKQTSDAAARLGKIALAQKFAHKAEQALVSCPREELLHQDASLSLVSPERAKDVPGFDVKLWQAIKRTEDSDKPNFLANILLHWLQYEVDHSIISIQEALCILGFDVQLPASVDQKLGLVGIRSLDVSNKIFGHPDPVSEAMWEKQMEPIGKWLRCSGSLPSSAVRHMTLAAIQATRISQMAKLVQKSSDIELEFRCIRSIEYCITLLSSFPKDIFDAMPYLQKYFRIVRSARTLQIIGLTLKNEARGCEQIPDDGLLRCIKDEEDSIAFWNQSNTFTEIIKCQRNIAHISWRRYMLYGSVSADACLPALEEVEKLYVHLRRARKHGDNWETFFNIKALADSGLVEVVKTESFDHCDRAVIACLEAAGILRHREFVNRVPREAKFVSVQPELVEKIVTWTQRKKAKAVNEIMGRNLLLSCGSLEQPWTAAARLAAPIPGSQQLLDAELILHRSLEEASTNFDREMVMIELHQLWEKMRNAPDLKHWMNRRDGAAISFNGLKSLAPLCGDGIVFVDYFWIQRTWSGADKIEYLPHLYRNGFHKRMNFVEQLCRNDVKIWIEDHMDESRSRILARKGSLECLNDLNSLLTNLEGFSQIGDTIVICPTGLLHRVPLHALKLEGQILIERNPVVYCQSLSLLEQHIFSTLTAARATSLRAVIVNGLPVVAEDSTPKFAFAAELDVKICNGPGLTKETLKANLGGASLFHFHGHIGYDESNPLDHYLDLGGGERLAARDIANLRLKPGALVVLIGCESGRAQNTGGDNLVGLCTAFFFANAGSVISTLWPIDRKDGDDFAEAFYKQILQQRKDIKNGRRGWVELAHAVQQAVLAIRLDAAGKVRVPYHWAGFVVHGSPRSTLFEAEKPQPSPFKRYSDVRNLFSNPALEQLEGFDRQKFRELLSKVLTTKEERDWCFGARGGEE